MKIVLVLVLVLAACSAKKSPCDTVKVHVDRSTVIELPVGAEYCLYTPNTASCCIAEGTHCEQLDNPPHIFQAIERAPGCNAPPMSKP